MPLVVSPLMAMDVATLPPGSTFGPREMRDWQFLWFLQGNCTYIRDDVAYPVPQDSLVFCVPGGKERFLWDVRRPTRCVYVHFNVLEVPEEWEPFTGWPPVRPARSGDVFTFGFTHLLSLIQGGANPLAQSLTLSLMLEAWRQPAQPMGLPDQQLPECVTRALEWLHHNLDERPAEAITLTQMAAAGCVTPGYLCRAFMDATGKPPMQTVMLARLDRALELVCHSELPMRRIAAMCGFADAAHLGRRFQHNFGVAPATCRRQVRAGTIPPEPSLIRRLSVALGDQSWVKD